MSRGPRLLLSQSYYHVITRGNNRNTVFPFDIDYFHYLGLIEKYKKQHPFNLYHYCLMPNHVHFLIQTHNASEFSRFMKKLNLSYFYYFKKNYGWSGHFWQDRFRSQPVGKDSYFIQCGKYIELNPVRAGIIDKPEKYPYSSYRFYAYGDEDDLLTQDFNYLELSKNIVSRQNKYKKMVISDLIIDSYSKKIWGCDNQRYNEAKKIYYNLKTKITKHEAI